MDKLFANITKNVMLDKFIETTSIADINYLREY